MLTQPFGPNFHTQNQQTGALFPDLALILQVKHQAEWMHAVGRRGEGAGDEAAGGCTVSAGNEDGAKGSRRGEDQAQAGLP